MKPKKVINQIKIITETDESPDTSCIGEYTDSHDNWIINRATGEYCDTIYKRQRIIDALKERIDCPEDFCPENADRKQWELNQVRRMHTIEISGNVDFPNKGRTYRFFKPYAGGEKPGTKEYKKYGLQDFKRMEALIAGQWGFFGTHAEAEITMTKTGVSFTIQSSGLWGIESDSENRYIKILAKEQLEELTELLTELGFSKTAIAKAMENKIEITK